MTTSGATPAVPPGTTDTAATKTEPVADDCSDSIRVAVVDDQQLFCTGVRMMIDSQDDLEFAGMAGNGRDGVALSMRELPDVVLMDVRMPETDGIDATREIVRRSADLGVACPKIVVLTTFHRDGAVVRAIQAGAAGFIMKDTTPEFILASIRTVHAGQAVIAPADTIAMLRGLSPAEEPRQARADRVLSPLSTRERELYLLVAKGLSNSEIAASTFIGENTVKTHVRNILSKLCLGSRVQIVAHAYENKLME